jgi:putative two-component system response regulator
MHSYLTVDFPLLDLDRQAYGVGSISTEVTELVRSRAETREAWLESMSRLARAVEYRDDVTGAHIERIAAYAELLAHLIGLPEERCAQIRLAAPLHDLGKIAIPDRVLLKRGQLTLKERQVMETHADVGYRLLAGSGSEILELGATIARYHHERYDGAGYPVGLRGTEIPIEARIVAIVDVFDALTADRVYRGAVSIDRAVQAMQADAGHFDPDMLEVFVRRLDLVKGVWAIHHPSGPMIRVQRPPSSQRHHAVATSRVAGSEP